MDLLHQNGGSAPRFTKFVEHPNGCSTKSNFGGVEENYSPCHQIQLWWSWRKLLTMPLITQKIVRSILSRSTPSPCHFSFFFCILPPGTWGPCGSEIEMKVELYQTLWRISYPQWSCSMVDLGESRIQIYFFHCLSSTKHALKTIIILLALNPVSMMKC